MSNITIAVPKGRILAELLPILDNVGIKPEADFFDESSRKLQFDSNQPDISFIRVRSFDVATFVANGAAEIGICGSDVLAEFDYDGIYSPIDLDIGKCRLSIAAANDHLANIIGDMSGIDKQSVSNKWLGYISELSHIRVASKYPRLTKSFFANYGVMAESIKLNGAMELAPKVDLAEYIVDLVSSGNTLRQNNLYEITPLLEVSSRLIINRVALKTNLSRLKEIIAIFSDAVTEKLN